VRADHAWSTVIERKTKEPTMGKIRDFLLFSVGAALLLAIALNAVTRH
jgi:hypothetical protein